MTTNEEAERDEIDQRFNRRAGIAAAVFLALIVVAVFGQRLWYKAGEAERDRKNCEMSERVVGVDRDC